MKISLILLAAGNSRRFGGNKLLELVEGKSMYLHIADEIEGLERGLFCQKIIVTQYDEIASVMEERGYITVRNPYGGSGIASSVKLGLAKTTGEAACFAVCDQPYLKGDTITAFLKNWIDSGKGIGCIGFGERTGNPVVFSQKYFGEFKTLEGDQGGKRILVRHPEDVYIYEAEEKQELEDIDIRRNL